MTRPKITLTLALLVVAIGCQKNRTEIVLGMATDLSASTPLSSVRLQVFSLPDDVLIADQELPISGTVNELYELPGTYAVYSATGSADRFRALLTATDNNSKTLVVRSAVLSLVPGKTLFARLGMVSACEGMTDCGTGQTCIEGHCTSEDVDSSRLPEYTQGMENQVACVSGTTFVDTSTKQPLKVSGTSCGAGTCLEGVCLAPPPTDAGTHDAGSNQDAGPNCSTGDAGGAAAMGTTVVTAVSVGYTSACAITAGGGVVCWGSNIDGVLGGDCASGSAVPVPVTGLSSGVTAVSVGFYGACAVTANGGVECWGDNTSGALGNNSTTKSSTPVQVTGLTSGATAVSVGLEFACAVASGGSAECWGANSWGQLGNNSTTESHVPVSVSGLASGVKAVSTSVADGAGNISCAVTSAGAALCWGYNGSGQLGNNSVIDSRVPVQVSGLTSGVTAISVGAGLSEDPSTCAITAGGGVMCWGENLDGELGNNSTADSRVPVQVSGLTSDVTSISVGNHFACAVTAAGGVMCWGNNDSGQLGNNSTTGSSTPVQVTGLTSGAIAVSAGDASACAVLSGGAVSCWGSNQGGQLGNNSKTNSPIPVHVTGTGADVTSTTACNDLTTTMMATCSYAQAASPTQPRQSNLAPPPDGTYILTNATWYGQAAQPGHSCEMLVRIAGTQMDVFSSGFNGNMPGTATYTIGWVTGGPWVNMTQTCPVGGSYDPLTSMAAHFEGGAAAQLGYNTVGGGLILGQEAIDPNVGGSGWGGNPIIYTFAKQ